MADEIKQIKNYDITALGDTDSFVKQSEVGVTSRVTYSHIKDSFDDRYEKKGTVIWEDASGATSGTPTINFVVGHMYKTYVYNALMNGISYNVVNFIINAFPENFSTVYEHQYLSEGKIQISETLFTTYSYVIGTATPTDSNEFKVYKIIDMGVAQ